MLLIPGYLWEVKPHGPQADTASSSSLVIDGALIHFIILNTGEFCLPFFLCTVFGVLGFWFVFLVFFQSMMPQELTLNFSGVDLCILI